MSTIDDMASDAEERLRDAALADHARRAAKSRLIPCGRCLWCDADVPGNALFCRADGGGSCRDEYERAQAARLRNGR